MVFDQHEQLANAMEEEEEDRPARASETTRLMNSTAAAAASIQSLAPAGELCSSHARRSAPLLFSITVVGRLIVFLLRADASWRDRSRMAPLFAGWLKAILSQQEDASSQPRAVYPAHFRAKVVGLVGCTNNWGPAQRTHTWLSLFAHHCSSLPVIWRGSGRRQQRTLHAAAPFITGARFPIVAGPQNQSPQSRGYRGGCIGQLRHPRRNLQIQRRQPEQNSDFHQRSYSLGLNWSATSSHEENDDVSSLYSNTGLSGLSIGKKPGEIIPLQCRRFRITGAVRNKKPQRSRAPPENALSAAKHQRRTNPRLRRTRSPAPLATGYKQELAAVGVRPSRPCGAIRILRSWGIRTLGGSVSRLSTPNPYWTGPAPRPGPADLGGDESWREGDELQEPEGQGATAPLSGIDWY
nr:unnamed protein product [Digitaria exilis]